MGAEGPPTPCLGAEAKGTLRLQSRGSHEHGVKTFPLII